MAREPIDVQQLVDRRSEARRLPALHAAMDPSAELAGQRDDDPLQGADEAGTIVVLVLLQFANELRAAGS